MRRAFLGQLALAACVAYPGGDPARRGDPPRPRGGPPPDHAWLAGVEIPDHLARPGRETETAIARAVLELASDDFAAYSGAARDLVSMGEVVVPYLGHVGEREADPERVGAVVTVILRPVLTGAPAAHVGQALRSPYRAVRVAAAGVSGERRLTEHAPKLVALLDDGVLQVRRSAIMALRMISNRFYGYRAHGSESSRARAVAKWRELWGAG